MTERPGEKDGISDACNKGRHYDCPKCKRCTCHERFTPKDAA